MFFAFSAVAIHRVSAKISGLMFKGIGIWMVCTALCSGQTDLSAHEAEAHNILFINSYSSEDRWATEVAKAFRHYLFKRNFTVNFDNYELSVRFRPDVRPTEGDFSALRAKLNSDQYDMVVVFGNNAADLFLDRRLEMPQNTSLFVLGYYGDFTKKKLALTRISGVLSAIPPSAGIRLIRTLQPDVHTVAVIADASAAGCRFIEETRADSRSFPEFNFVFLSGSEYTTTQMLEQVAVLPAGSAILFSSWGSRKERLSEHSYTVIPKIRERFNGLIISRARNYIPEGADGGLLIPESEHGELGGLLAERMLKAQTSDILPRSAVPNLRLDYSICSRLGIHPENAPQETQWINIPSGFMIQNWPWLAGGGILVVAGLLLWITFLLSKRRTLNRVNAVFCHLPLRTGVADYDGNILFYQSGVSHPGDLPNPFRNLKQLGSQGEHLLEALRQLKKDGGSQEIPYEHNGEKLYLYLTALSENNPFGVPAAMWVSYDFTKLSESFREVSRMAERFQLTLESINDGVIVTDRNGCVTLFNAMASNLTGFSEEEVKGRPVWDILCLKDIRDGSAVPSPAQLALSGSKSVKRGEFPVLFTAKDGSEHHIDYIAAPIIDGGISGAVMIFRDVTNEHEKRDRLARQSTILKNAATLAGFCHFHCDSSGNHGYEMVPEYYWPQPSGIPVSPEEWITPEDLPGFIHGWKQLKSHQTDMIHLKYSAGPENAKRYFEMRIERSNTDSAGDLLGVIQDVTAIRENERRFRDNFDLLEMIINHIPCYLFVKDATNEFRYLMTNRIFRELFAAGRECDGLRDIDLFPDSKPLCDAFEEEDRQIDQNGTLVDSVDIVPLSNGKKLTVRTVKNRLQLSNGRRLIVALGMDISKQQAMEDELRHSIQRLNTHIEWERLINQALTDITLGVDFNQTIRNVLSLVGTSVGADRCYMFRFMNDDPSFAENCYEFTKIGKSFPDTFYQSCLSMNRLPNWHRMLQEHKEIVIPDTQSPPPGWEMDFEQLREWKVRAQLVSGIWIEGRLYGFVGLHFHDTPENFSENGQRALSSLAMLYRLILERQSQINRIEDSVALQRQIIDNISIPIAIIDLDCKIRSANPSLLALLGCSFEDVKDQKCYHLLCGQPSPPSDCPLALSDANQAQPSSHEIKHQGRSYIVNSQPIFDRAGNLQYVLKAIIDITDMSRQQEAWKHAMERAQAADRAKSYFLSTVSHEIRTPLNAVIGFAELLKDGTPTAEIQQSYLDAIVCSGNALLQIVNDVLDLSKLEAEQMQINPEALDFREVGEEVMKVFAHRAAERRLGMKIEIAGLPLLELDKLRIRQILFNLVGNAVKFTRVGSVTLRAVFKRVCDDSGTLTIEVRDTGIGIPQADMHKILEPFVQVTGMRGSHAANNGTGLGLAITKRLAEKMNGSLSVSSIHGVGSVFSITLQNVRMVKRAELTANTENPVEDTTDFEDFSILLVDDVEMNLKVLKAICQKCGITRIQCVQSGSEALKMLQSETFSAVLTDMWMPGMNGSELAEKMNGDSRLKVIPVVAVTADIEAQDNFSLAGFADILLKPVTVEKVRAVLKKISGRG